MAMDLSGLCSAPVCLQSSNITNSRLTSKISRHWRQWNKTEMVCHVVQVLKMIILRKKGKAARAMVVQVGLPLDALSKLRTRTSARTILD